MDLKYALRRLAKNPGFFAASCWSLALGIIAAAAGFSGTPSFVIGRSSGSGLSGDVIIGALNWPVFDVRS